MDLLIVVKSGVRNYVMVVMEVGMFEIKEMFICYLVEVFDMYE